MRKFLAVFMMCVATTAYAADKPVEVASLIRAEAPLGEGALDKLVFHVYDASLWTDATSWSMNKPFALTLKYGMGFDSEDFIERTVEEMKKATDATAAQRTAYAPLLKQVFPAVKKGDRITARYTPGKGTDFFYNGKATGSISVAAQPQFAQQFFAIWLGAKTSEPELRNQLLGKK